MKKIISIAFLIVNFAASTRTNGTEMNNVSAPGSDSEDTKETNSDDVTSVSRILDFYNTDVLAANWKFVNLKLTNSCREDVGRYIDGLKKAEKWALKVEDASGKYSTGWFWGNQFWIGSQSLCENITPNSTKVGNHNQQYKTRTRRDLNDQPDKFSPSQSKGYDDMLHINSFSPSPFEVAFFTLRININTTISAKTRIIYLGLCLPKICTEEDVKILVEGTSKASDNVATIVESVRSPHHYFNIWEDSTFKALCITTAVFCVLLMMGTGYDFYSKPTKNKTSLKIECTTYSNPEDKLTDKHIKLNVPDMNVRNALGYSILGKCCLHVNNNNNDHINNNENPNENTTTEEKDSAIIYILKQILLSFSLKININSICDRSVGSDTISSIHGLKAFSMIWVILGHTCIVGFKYSDNMEYRRIVQKEFFFQTITNGAFSVDTFFFTSGLLVSFLYFRSNAKGKLDSLGRKGFLAGCTHFIGLIAYRFARLSVPYLFVLGMVEVCMKWFNYNSIFEPPTMDHVNCPKYWWRNILYINTLFPDDQMCMLWSWYLSDDTQFYVLGAILLIIGVSHFKTAATAMILFLLSSWFTTGYVSLSNSHLPSTNDPLALFDKIYDKPWTRLGPYFIGMMVGWLLFKTNCRIKMSKLAVIVGWLVSTACLLSLVYGLYEVDISPIAGAAYSSLSHTAWAVGLAWIVVACATGYGGFASSILSATILYPVSRITYCAYLLHPLVMRVMVMNMDSPIHLGKPLMVTIFLGQVLMSYVLGFVVSVMFEAPVVAMLKILTKIGPGKQKNVAP